MQCKCCASPMLKHVSSGINAAWCAADFVVEPAFTPANINSSTFKIVRQWPVDGAMYAQPLYAPQVCTRALLHTQNKNSHELASTGRYLQSSQALSSVSAMKGSRHPQCSAVEPDGAGEVIAVTLQRHGMMLLDGCPSYW